MSGLLRIPALIVATLAALLPAGTPAVATQVEVFLEIRPNTIRAGYQIGLLASCGEKLNPAVVRSRAFGEVTLLPQPHSDLLGGTVLVPADTDAGEYRVALRCADGARASAKLFVIDGARPTRGPDTGGGGTAADATAAGGSAADGTMSDGTAADGTAAGGTVAALAPVLLAAGGVTAFAIGTGLLLSRRRSVR